jgi:hypothetical protein
LVYFIFLPSFLNSIVIFEKPSFMLNSIDSDWKLLEDLKVGKWNNLVYWQYYFQSAWGWTVPFLPQIPASSLSTPHSIHFRSGDEDEGGRLSDEHHKRNKHRKRKSHHHSHRKDGDNRISFDEKPQERNSMIVRKGSDSFLGFIPKTHLFWSIAFVISGVLVYFIIYRDSFTSTVGSLSAENPSGQL